MAERKKAKFEKAEHFADGCAICGSKHSLPLGRPRHKETGKRKENWWMRRRVAR